MLSPLRSLADIKGDFSDSNCRPIDCQSESHLRYNQDFRFQQPVAMAVISIAHMVVFFEDETKLIGRGENAYRSGRVEQFTFDGSLGIIRGKIRSSLKDIVYTVEVGLGEDGIDYGRCSCPRGLYKCHHMACILLYAMFNISKTDLQCSWIKRKETKQVKTVGQICESSRHSYIALNRSVNNSDKEWLYGELIENHSVCGFSWLLAPNFNEEVATAVPLVDEVIYSEGFVRSELNCDYFMGHIKLNQDLILKVVEQTSNQRDNPLWYMYRKGRLTASNFGLALKCFKKGKMSLSATQTLLGNKNLSGVKAIQWGTEMESTALRLFQEHFQLTVQPTGLWLHHTGVIGASPDGLIPDLNATVEVKCPYSVREKTITEACATNNFFLTMDDYGTISLRRNHPYFDQIQGQMYLTGALKCYFVVYTTKELFVTEINKDDNWESNIDNLVNFYVHYILPHMIGTAQAEHLNQS